MLENDLLKIAKDYFVVWSNKDLTTLGQMFSEEIVLKDWEKDYVGKQNVLKANEEIFNNTTNLSVTVHDISHTDDIVFARLTVNAGNKKIPVVDVIKFNDNFKISSIRAYRGN